MQCVSTMATQPLDAVARAGQGSPALWFQLYVLSDRDFVRAMVLSAPHGCPDARTSQHRAFAGCGLASTRQHRAVSASHA